MSKALLTNVCFYCQTEFAPLQQYYIIRYQKRKFEKRIKLGKCCETCEQNGNKTSFNLWNGDTLPEISK